MAYKLNVTEHADELLDNLMYYLIYRLKNKQAAKHLLDGIDVIYDRLEVNPFQFADCRDAYLAKKGYREAVVPQMNYIIIFPPKALVMLYFPSEKAPAPPKPLIMEQLLQLMQLLILSPSMGQWRFSRG